MEKLKTNLQRRITLPMVVVLMALAALVIYTESHVEFDKLRDQHIADTHKSQRLMSEHLNHEAEFFEKLADQICQDPLIRKAFVKGDRQRLLKLTAARYEDFNSIHGLIHFDFHQPDQISFLQVHNPSSYGNITKRHTLAREDAEDKPSHGIEIGPRGALTFRYVHPWHVDGERIGFMELGKEIGMMTQSLKKVLEFEFVITVDKSLIHRDSWEKNLKLPYRSGHWDWLDDALVVEHTFRKFPAELAEVLEDRLEVGSTDQSSRIMLDGGEHFIGSFPLTDGAGEQTAQVFVIADIRVPAAIIAQSSMFFGTMILAMGFCAAILCYFYIGSIEKQLKETDKNHRIELTHRKFAEVQMTEAKERAEAACEELMRVKEKLTLHVNQTPLGVIQWSTEFTIERWNPPATAIFGYTAQEAIGRTANELIVPEDIQSSIDKVCGDLLKAAGPSINQNENLTRDGRRIMCKWYNTPLIDQDARVIGATSIVEDITPKLEYERRLKEAKERAEAANQLKNRFLANMTHELRTPMNAILGFIELLKDEELTVDQQDYIDTIDRSSRHLLELINDILDLSKIEAGKEEIAAGVCSLRVMLRQLEEMMHHNARSKGLELVLDIQSNLPEQVITDAKHLHQCLLNLVANAIKFTDSGSVIIHAGLMENDGSASLYFEIADTGIGIPEDRQAKVFESFEQADCSTSRKYGGTGLGLSITRELIEMMGGTIELESHVGIGSIFSITLPVEVVSQTASQA
jgi:PAS domain S-box-containing protein